TIPPSSLYCYLPHLHLHSFPTRRSSDLGWLTISPLIYRRGTTCFKRSSGLSLTGKSVSKNAETCIAPSRRSCHRISAPPSVLGRSEEHTSELQSLRHLVCRLLLEKKKKT